jgi:hypothetical protein
MLMEEKDQLKVYLPRRLLKEFRVLVAQKHGTYRRGLLSFEVEAAVKQYMATFRSTHSDAQKSSLNMKASLGNPYPKVHKLKQQIMEWLQTTGTYAEGVPRFIPESHLNAAISALKGSDPRTLRNWTSSLLSSGYMKKSGPHQFEFD